MSLQKLLEGNAHFVSDVFRDGSEFEYCLKGQSPHTLIIACADSRVPPELIFGAKPGEIFIHRNIGNMVPPGDWNVATVIEYAVNHLGVTTVAVLGHGRCGAIKALAENHGGHDAYIPGWIYHGYQAYVSLSKRMPYPDNPEAQLEWLCELEKENVRVQLKHLHTYPVISAALAAKKISVAGLYYDMVTGTVSQIA